MPVLRVCTLVLVLAPALSAIGCASTAEEDLEQLRFENEELRAREAQLRDALQDAEGRAIALENERARLLGEAESLRGRLEDASTRRQSGFEGIEGTTTRRQGADIVVDVEGDVLFASGSVTLRSQAQRTLNSIAQVLNSRYSGNEIRIAGHTDSDPIRKSKWGTNERLSAERALAVEAYLATRGVDKDRMHIAGFGPAKPRGSKSQSRRVEIVVLGG